MWLAGQNCRKVEAEAVDAHFGCPVAQRIRHHLEHALVAQINRIPRSGVVDVIAFVGCQPVIRGVVDAFERQRRPEFGSFRRVIVNDIQNHLDTTVVEVAHHFLDLVDKGRREIAGLRREEGNRVIAPIVSQFFLDEVIVIDESVDRQEFDCGHAQICDVIDHLRRHHSRERAAEMLRHAGMAHRIAAHMGLVDDRALPRRLRLALLAPGKGGIDNTAFRHVTRTVAFVER